MQVWGGEADELSPALCFQLMKILAWHVSMDTYVVCSINSSLHQSIRNQQNILACRVFLWMRNQYGKVKRPIGLPHKPRIVPGLSVQGAIIRTPTPSVGRNMSACGGAPKAVGVRRRPGLGAERQALEVQPRCRGVALRPNGLFHPFPTATDVCEGNLGHDNAMVGQGGNGYFFFGLVANRYRELGQVWGQFFSSRFQKISPIKQSVPFRDDYFFLPQPSFLFMASFPSSLFWHGNVCASLVFANINQLTHHTSSLGPIQIYLLSGFIVSSRHRSSDKS